MKRGFGIFILLGAAVGYTATPAADVESTESLVFGSFSNPENAANWAARVGLLLNTPIEVETLRNAEGVWYRVVTTAASETTLNAVRRAADSHKLTYWRLTRLPGAADIVAETLPEKSKTPPPGPVRHAPPVRASKPALIANQPGRDAADTNSQLDFDLGLQTRTYRVEGFNGQSRFQPSLSAQLDYYRTWDKERQSLTFAPYIRYDAEDSERSHFDVRELFWSQVGNDWDLHVGVRQVFWGVTEFHHLVDILNQTDLVENIDGEDKLGQPMVHLSLVRDWGILDIFALPGFRERTFPGQDGRLRTVPMVDGDHPIYESGAKNTRVDGAIRWSHNLGPFEFGIYHFTGTSREPQLVPWGLTSGEIVLRPRYPVIDQTGLEALAVLGDWALKLEVITRSGFGPRYAAFNVGFEKTLVGVMGTRTDLGLVAEYMFDDRDDEAFNTVFEHDLAFGTRWSMNDIADTQALLGVIWDVKTEEYFFSMEASRRLGETWTLLLEGRVFGGADEPDSNALLQSLFDADNKTASLQRDDFIQLELTKYF
ncbi:MAG: hypothetical protein IH908_00845 [Proteobacteria bacterium]|nr:hypothetical protein [Pseudomonadota bacterium]